MLPSFKILDGKARLAVEHFTKGGGGVSLFKHLQAEAQQTPAGDALGQGFPSGLCIGGPFLGTKPVRIPLRPRDSYANNQEVTVSNKSEFLKVKRTLRPF